MQALYLILAQTRSKYPLDARQSHLAQVYKSFNCVYYSLPRGSMNWGMLTSFSERILGFGAKPWAVAKQNERNRKKEYRNKSKQTRGPLRI